MHFGSHFSPSIEGQIVNRGYLAVDLFFVLSGMVMFHVYERSIRLHTFSFQEFIYKRFARLYPVHLATLIVAIFVLISGHILGLKVLPDDFLFDIFANTIMIHGWGVTNGMSLNYPSWSISAEFFAYLVFLPVSLFVLHLRDWTAFFIGVALFFLFAFTIEHFGTQSGRVAPEGGLLLTRLTYDFSNLRILPEFVLGIAACRIVKSMQKQASVRRTHGAVASVVFFLALILSIELSKDAMFVLFAPLFLGALYIWNPKPNRAIIYLGEISYSIYMVHALVQMVGFTILERSLGVAEDEVPLVFTPLMLFLAIAAGSMLFHVVEVPCRQHIIKRLSNKAGYTAER